MLFVVALGTACNSSSTSAPIRTSMATVIRESFNPPYYLVLDDGKSAYVTNYSKWNPGFEEDQEELRYMLTYYDIDSPIAGYDKQVEVISVNKLISRQMENVGASDFEGDKGLQNYVAGVTIDQCYYAPARSYLTLQVRYNGGNAYTPHNIRLVKNDPATSQFADHYVANDGYLWLELYHDDSNDKGTLQIGNYVSYKLPYNIIDTYNGVKIISRNWNSGTPEVYTCEFKLPEINQ